MKSLSVLFYVEPVMFHNNPTHLKAWIDLAARFCWYTRYDNHIRVSFASSPWLCRVMTETNRTKHRRILEVSARAVLAPFAFDRNAYGADLFLASHAPEVNRPLAEALRNIAEVVQPDIVVCFTQNRYIESVFADQRTLFWEMGPMPRIAGGLSFFMDPSGHQTASLLNVAAERILTLPMKDSMIEETLQKWQTQFVDVARHHPKSAEFANWLNHAKQGRKVALFSMQPPDWLTYEAAYGVLGIDNLIMRWLAELPDDWVAIPTYHPSYILPRDAEEAIYGDFVSLLLPPPELVAGITEFLPTWTGISEIVLPWVDGVVTISSSVGIHGMLQGKSIVSRGKSSLMTLSDDVLSSKPTLNDAERARLLAFLSHRYCRPYDLCVDGERYMVDLFAWLADVASPIDAYLDLEDWSPDNISLFTAAKGAS